MWLRRSTDATRLTPPWLLANFRILHTPLMQILSSGVNPTQYFFFSHEEYTSQKLNYFSRASSCITDSGLMTFSVPLFRVKSGLGIVFLIHIRWISCYRKKKGYHLLVSFLFATFMQPHKIFTL